MFQSTLPRRERRGSGDVTADTNKFQSTLPRRERLIPSLQDNPSACCFNPRSRVGSDRSRSCSTSSWRACFNPRSRVGSDLPVIVAVAEPERFNPRSRVGSDVSEYLANLGFGGFNPRSRVGSDCIVFIYLILFSLRYLFCEFPFSCC